jgi:hypothetical protein
VVDIDAAVQGVVDALTAAGVRATQDGRSVNPPCALVRPPTLHYRFGKGSYEADFELWAIVPSTGHRTDLIALGELVTAVQGALNFAGVTATPDETSTADGGTVPMYRLTWSTRIPA